VWARKVTLLQSQLTKQIKVESRVYSLVRSHLRRCDQHGPCRRTVHDDGEVQLLGDLDLFNKHDLTPTRMGGGGGGGVGGWGGGGGGGGWGWWWWQR
jgi:hypothetical protein